MLMGLESPGKSPGQNTKFMQVNVSEIFENAMCWHFMANPFSLFSGFYDNNYEGNGINIKEKFLYPFRKSNIFAACF